MLRGQNNAWGWKRNNRVE